MKKASKKPPSTLATISADSRTGTVIENTVSNSDTDIETPSSLASVVSAFNNKVYRSLLFFYQTQKFFIEDSFENHSKDLLVDISPQKLTKRITVFYFQKEELAKAASLKEQKESPSTATTLSQASQITVVPEHQDTVIEVTSNVTKVSLVFFH